MKILQKIYENKELRERYKPNIYSTRFLFMQLQFVIPAGKKTTEGENALHELARNDRTRILFETALNPVSLKTLHKDSELWMEQITVKNFFPSFLVLNSFSARDQTVTSMSIYKKQGVLLQFQMKTKNSFLRFSNY